MKLKSGVVGVAVFAFAFMGMVGCRGKSDTSGKDSAKDGKAKSEDLVKTERDLKFNEIQSQIQVQQQRSIQFANQQRQMINQQLQMQRTQQQNAQNIVRSQRQAQQSIEAAKRAQSATQKH